MRTRRRATIEDLRLAIDCLPRATRLAMLDGIRSNRIIAGAYSNRGVICPMLAAHRAGGRTSLIAFARAWDRFVFGGARVAKPRPATARELLILRSHLEASLLAEEVPESELAAAIASHEKLLERRRHATGRHGDPDRTNELRAQPGWAWMRVVRGYDEYRATLGGLTDAHDGTGQEAPRQAEPAR